MILNRCASIWFLFNFMWLRVFTRQGLETWAPLTDWLQYLYSLKDSLKSKVLLSNQQALHYLHGIVTFINLLTKPAIGPCSELLYSLVIMKCEYLKLLDRFQHKFEQKHAVTIMFYALSETGYSNEASFTQAWYSKFQATAILGAVCAVPTRSGAGEVDTNYRSPTVRKWARGLAVLHMFFVFLISIITCRFTN
jgi:hypothetical protein